MIEHIPDARNNPIKQYIRLFRASEYIINKRKRTRSSELGLTEGSSISAVPIPLSFLVHTRGGCREEQTTSY